MVSLPQNDATFLLELMIIHQSVRFYIGWAPKQACLSEIINMFIPEIVTLLLKVTYIFFGKIPHVYCLEYETRLTTSWNLSEMF